MTDNRLSLSCLVDREATSNAFSIKILSSDTVDTLKGLIKTAVSHRFNDIAIKDLTLWQVSIPNDDQGSVITIDALDDKTELTNAGTQLSKLFPERPDDDTYIVVKRPPASPEKRTRKDEGPSFKRKHLGTYTLLDAIEETGLSEKAVVDGQSDLSLLNNKERVLLLDFLGQSVDRSERYNSLSSTARQLQGTNIKDMDKLSAPRSARFPGIGTNDLYVRQAYKDLFDKILGKFENNHEFKKHVIVTGTSGIGNSAFLVYFAIRLLAESDESNPPMIIFHTNYREECYIFGGHTTVRYGNIDDFRPFLNLPDTWYLVDGSLKPLLSRAKTVISAPPKTLQGHQYKDVDRSVVWRYFMAPWNLEERKNCRSSVTAFQVVPEETMEELYSEIGGVPRYVLDWPTEILDLFPNNLKYAKTRARSNLQQALNNVPNPKEMMQFLAQEKDTLELSGHLIRRWPLGDERDEFRLEWASASVARKFSTLLTEATYSYMLRWLVSHPEGSASGIMFEAYVLRIFREGGHTFNLKDLQTGKSARLNIPRSPVINVFDTITSAAAGELWILENRNDAGVDLLLAPRDLFQVTVSSDHPIKGMPLSKLIGSLIQAGWIDRPEEARLIFVIPSHANDRFQKQNYLTSAGTADQNLPENIEQGKQYVLKIDVESAAAGKAPGLQVPPQ